MERKALCSLCEKFSAFTACKCDGKITFLGKCCIDVHMEDKQKDHEQIAINIAKFFINRQSLASAGSIYSQDCTDLLDTLTDYSTKITQFRDDVQALGNSMTERIQLTVNKALARLNSIEKDIQLKVGVVKAQMERPFKEGVQLIEKYRAEKMKGVLDYAPEYMIKADDSVIKNIKNFVYIGNEPPEDESQKRVADLEKMQKHLEEAVKEIKMKDAHIAQLEQSIKEQSEQMEYSHKQLDLKRKELSEHVEMIEWAKQELSQKECKLEILTHKLEETQKSFTSKNDYLDRLEAQNGQLNNQIADLKESNRLLKQTLAIKDENLAKEVLRAKQTREESAELINSLRVDVTKLLVQLQSALAEIKEKDEKLHELEESYKKLSSSKISITESLPGSYIYIPKDKTSTLLEYNTLTDTLRKIKISTFLQEPFNTTSSCILRNGDVFLAGGQNPDSNYAYIVTPENRQCVQLPNMLNARGEICLVCYRDHVYAFGGANSNGISSKVERYNFILDEWRPMVDMKEARSRMTCVPYRDVIIIIGGYWNKSIEEFDIVNNRSTLIETTCFKWGNIGGILQDSIYILDYYNYTELNTSYEFLHQDLKCWKKYRYTFSNVVIFEDEIYYYNYSTSTVEKFKINNRKVKEIRIV